eukprot:GILK01004248.1.p1 GENE.GILK01004248.1~~GILK01004248.1.p1  ORF type:complete len:603 (+),score=113.06 GILK01004248.1:68-1810(+)
MATQLMMPRPSSPNSSSKSRERWTDDEHTRFVEALQMYGRNWKKVQAHVKTKTAIQVRSHGYGYFSKLQKDNLPDAIPPPRRIKRAFSQVEVKHEGEPANKKLAIEHPDGEMKPVAVMSPTAALIQASLHSCVMPQDGMNAFSQWLMARPELTHHWSALNDPLVAQAPVALAMYGQWLQEHGMRAVASPDCKMEGPFESLEKDDPELSKIKWQDEEQLVPQDIDQSPPRTTSHDGVCPEVKSQTGSDSLTPMEMDEQDVKESSAAMDMEDVGVEQVPSLSRESSPVRQLEVEEPPKMESLQRQHSESGKKRERWTDEEHNKFLEGVRLYGKHYKKIQQHIGSKTIIQVRTHAYGYFTRIQKQGEEAGDEKTPSRQAGTPCDIQTPSTDSVCPSPVPTGNPFTTPLKEKSVPVKLQVKPVEVAVVIVGGSNGNNRLDDFETLILAALAESSECELQLRSAPVAAPTPSLAKALVLSPESTSKSRDCTSPRAEEFDDSNLRRSARTKVVAKPKELLTLCKEDILADVDRMQCESAETVASRPAMESEPVSQLASPSSSTPSSAEKPLKFSRYGRRVATQDFQ